MYSLAIETATDICSVAISLDGNILAESTVFASRKHSELLAIIIRQVLENHHVSPNQIDEVLISIGPGSFTGLRIGLSTAKGLVFANHTRLYALPTLLSTAWSVRELSSRVGVLHHSHQDMYFYTDYKLSSAEKTYQVQTGPLRESWDALVDIMPSDLPIVIQGEFPAEIANRILWNNPVHAGNLIALHRDFPGKWEIDEPFTLEPEYLRDFEAEKYRNPLKNENQQ